MTREVVDIEANGLIDNTTVDYTTSPYKLKDSYKIWCLVQRNVDDPTIVKKYVGMDEIRSWAMWELPKITEFVAHNGIDYDLLALKLAGLLNYKVSNVFGESSTINGKPCKITDTMVMSKTLNPDRYKGHSLDELGKTAGGAQKIDWRSKAVELGLISPNAPKGAEFQQYHPEMLVYCEGDTATNVDVLLMLEREAGDWNWEFPLWLEHAVRDVITRQSHRGFKFDNELAHANVRDLDQRMEEIRELVEPLLPEKPMGVTKLKAYLPPKVQFKKDGTVSAALLKWAEKHEGSVQLDAEGCPTSVTVFGKAWAVPMNCEVPVLTHEPAEVKDITHIKGWLVELGWRPTMYKERDLTCDAKKNKLSQEKFEIAVNRYVDQTLASPFCKDRCEELNTTPRMLREKLLRHDIKRPLKVYTNPTITVGPEKEMDERLLELAAKFPHAKLISEYLTYAHRRNSILGGGFDPDDVDEDDEFAGKGYMASSRISDDGRIPTPADTCGAGTSRFKHRLVANIPRTTSLYGENMRAMFGSDVENGYYQLGYDFASLEAMIEAHYCWRYDNEDKAYCLSLTREKPFDVHTITAQKISQVIGQEFKRTPAKSVKYCCSYGGQPKRVAKTIGCSEAVGEQVYVAFWEAAKPLALLSEKLKDYWKTKGEKKFVIGIDGRKVPTRSASALINSLFQSAGVICAKLSMVIHDKKMEDAGLSVDFFVEDWKGKAFAQQMVAYHDESQLEVHKSLIKWKTFKTEEEAVAFKKSNPGWSEIGHTEKGYYVGDCIVGRLIQEAVVETSRYFKLNVTLAADYILGKNWAQCH